MSRQSESEFKQKAATVLQRWIRTSEQYRSMREVAIVLGIDPTKLGRIFRGFSISKTTEDYAKLYCLTGLEEVNPTTVPPEEIHTPNGPITTKKRAWTESEYQQWRDGKGKKIHRSPQSYPPPTPTGSAGAPASTQQLTQHPFVNTLALAEEFLDVLAKKIAERLQDHGLSISYKETSQSLGDQITQLTAQFESYLERSPEDRDELVAQYWRELRELKVVIDQLTTENRQDRERRIERQKKVEGK